MSRPSRILLAGLFHETHSFLEGTTMLSDFSVLRGDDLLTLKGTKSAWGGVLDEAESFGWEILPMVDYRAPTGALVEDLAFEAFWADLVDHATPHLTAGVDGIFLVLHGATISQSFDDVAGEFLQRLRAIPGAGQVPIFAVVDLHANITPRMAKLTNGLIATRENHSIDSHEVASEAARLFQRFLSSEDPPNQSFIQVPILWPIPGTDTTKDPLKTLESMAREMEKEPGVWAVSIATGFAFADTADAGLSFVILSTSHAGAHLQKLSDTAWTLRELGNAAEPRLSEVIGGLTEPLPGLTVIAELSDDMDAGASGDGTGLLRAFIHWRVPNCAICIVDAEAVTAASHMRVGDRVMLSIGGKGSRLDAGPVEIEVEVISHSSGKFERADTPNQFDMGPCAVVRHKELTILLTSIRTPPVDLGQWSSQGLDPSSFSVIGVKSATNHCQAYDPIAARMIGVDTSGPCSSHLKDLPFQKIRRPIYPLDDEA